MSVLASVKAIGSEILKLMQKHVDEAHARKHEAHTGIMKQATSIEAVTNARETSYAFRSNLNMQVSGIFKIISRAYMGLIFEHRTKKPLAARTSVF